MIIVKRIILIISVLFNAIALFYLKYFLSMHANNKGFSTTTTLVIFVLLFVPFVIRSLAPALEPYPAVVLPLGVGLFDVDKTVIEVHTRQIMAINKAGEWERIPPAQFLNPIPPYYIYDIAKNKFGLIPMDRREINTAFWGRLEVPRKPVTERDVESTQEWVHNRLRKLGYQDSVLRYRESLKTIDLQTDSLIQEIIVEEVDFELD